MTCPPSAQSNIAPFVNLEINVVRPRLAAFGFRLATPEEVGPTLDLAERLLGTKLTPEPVVAAVHAYTGMTVWCRGNPQISGFILSVPLTESGERAIRSGDFVPSNPDKSHLVAPGEECFGFYCWVYGGVEKEDRRAVMTACAILRVELIPTIPIFARGATEDGQRSMASLGMVALPNSLPDLGVLEPTTSIEEAA
ncbi:MAG: hypothetical protein AAFX02_02600 [Pseudomonadota bacterium]